MTLISTLTLNMNLTLSSKLPSCGLHSDLNADLVHSEMLTDDTISVTVIVDEEVLTPAVTLTLTLTLAPTRKLSL